MSDNDNFDAPEEFSCLQAIQQDEELTKVQHKSEARQVFLSDSEEEKNDKNPKQKKKRPKKSGVEPVVLNNIAAAPCLQSSIEFLKKRKMQVPRSNAVLKNSNQALRLMSSSGLLK